MAITIFSAPVTILNNSVNNSFPGAVVLADGTLLVTWRSASTHNGTGGGIAKSFSTDGGLTWTAPATVIPGADADGYDYRGGCITLLANGDIVMAAERRSAAGGGTEVPEGGVFKRSTDDGATWSANVVIDTEFTDWGRVLGPILELPNGDLLVTTYGEDSGDAQTSTRVMISTDDGATWTTLADIATGGTLSTEAWNEAGLFQRANGDLVAIVRQGVGGHWDQAVSTDDGATWSALTRIHTNAAGHPQPAKFGDYVVAVYRDVDGTGAPAIVIESDDEGATWVEGDTISAATSGDQMTYGQPVFDVAGNLRIVFTYEPADDNSDLFIVAPLSLAPVLSVEPHDTWAALELAGFNPSPFFPADVHTQTQYQVTTDADTGFASPIVDKTTSTDLLSTITDADLPDATDLRARTRTITAWGAGAWSDAVEFTTEAGATKGDTPTLTLVEKGQDFVEVEISVYNHVDGEVEPSVYADDPTHPVLSLSEIQRELQSDGDWNDPLETVSVTYLETTESRRYRFEDLTAGTAYKFRGRQLDGHLSVYTLYSSDLNVTTDAAPVNAPAQPTIGVSCGRTIVITGSAFSHGMGGTHAGTRVRLCYGSSCKTLNYSTAVTVVTLTDMPPGSVTLALAYQDNAGAWGPYSATSPCAVPDRPPVVVFLTPALGAVVSVNTNVTWEVYDPNAVGWTFDIELSDDGDTFTTVATDQVAASTMFAVLGKDNGPWYLRVRSRNPTTDETGEWATLPIELDRTGVRAFHVHFADYDSNEEMAEDGWVQIWDGPTLLSFALRDQFDPEDEETYRIGLEAKRVQNGSTIRRAGFVNTAWGQPDEFDLTVAFEHIPGGCDWYPYRFQNPEPTRAGSMLWGTHEGSERTGRLSVMRWQDGWFLGPDMQCVSDSFRNFAAATSARHANLPGNTTESFQYARSMTPGRFFQITDREGTGVVVTSASVAMTSTTEDRIGGPNFYWDEDNILGRNRQLFVMRQEVRRAVSGGSVGWNITTRIFGPGATLSSTTAFLREFDDSGNRVICGSCGIGFEDMDEQGVGRSDSVIFTDVSLRVHSYGGCVAPVEVGCQADWRFTTFMPDDVTPQYGIYDGDFLTGSVVEADYYDNRSCPRPFLMAVKDFSETEIDFAAGASDIGGIRVGVLDKRLTANDQDTGIVTAILDDCIGRRAVLERWREDLGYVTVFDGVIESVEMGEEISVYWFNLRDPRERERDVPMFDRNETFSVYPEVGPVEAYGFFPDPTDGYLIAPVAYEDGEQFHLLTPGGGDQGIHYGYVRLTAVSEEHIERWTYPIGFGAIDAANNRQFFPDVTIRWRPLAGSTWTYLRNMPAPLSPAYGSVLAGTRVTDNVVMTTGVLSNPALFLSSEDAGDLPTDGVAFEFQILAARTTETTPYMWDQGTFGDLLLATYRGEFTEAPPRPRYNEARLIEWAEETPRARFIVREPVKNMREWVQENVFAAIEHAPSFDEDMRIIPLPWELPPSDEVLVELDPDWIVPVGDFSIETSSVINRVSYTYIKEGLLPDDSTLLSRTILGQDQLSTYERLYEKSITRIGTFGDPEDPESSISLFGTKEIKYAPITVRGFLAGGLFGGLLTEVAGASFAEQISERVTENVLSRFGWGAHEYSAEVRSGMAHGPGFDPYTLDLVVGQWLIVDVPWVAEFSTGTRGHRRYMQIKSITDPEIHVRRLRLIDGGPVLIGAEGESEEGEEDFLPLPGIGTLSETDGRVEIPITFPGTFPAGYKVRVDFAVSATALADSSGLWQTLAYLTAAGTVFTPVIPAGSKVWVRARGELTGRRPTPWVLASGAFDMADTPGLLTFALSFASDGLVQAAWQPNDFAEGLRFEISTGVIGHSASFGVYDDVDSDTPLTLNFTGDELGYGEEAYIRVTAYPGFMAGSVTGSPGSVYTLRIERPDPTETADHALGDHTDTDFLPPEERTTGLVPMWTDAESDEPRFTLQEVPSLPIDINTDTTGTLDPNRGGTGLTDADLSGDVGKVIVVNGTADGFIFEDHYTKTEADAAIAALLPIDLTTEVTGELPAANAGVVSGGTTGQVLKKQSNTDFDYDWDTDSTGSGGYSEGTGFPGSPSTNDKFYRTDRNLLYYYDGSQWLTTVLFTQEIWGFVNPNATASSAGLGRGSHIMGAYDIYVVDAVFAHLLTGTGNWTLNLQKVNTSSSATTIATSGAFTSTSRVRTPVSVNAAVPTSDNITDFLLAATENSGTATLTLAMCAFTYRAIG